MKILLESKYKELTFQIIQYTLGETTYLCGYVEVPTSYKTKEEYNEIDCHGGVTYIGGKRDTGEGKYIGFDTLHAYSGTEHRTVEFCTTECKSMINQLLEKGVKNKI